MGLSNKINSWIKNHPRELHLADEVTNIPPKLKDFKESVKDSLNSIKKSFDGLHEYHNQPTLERWQDLDSGNPSVTEAKRTDDLTAGVNSSKEQTEKQIREAKQGLPPADQIGEENGGPEKLTMDFKPGDPHRSRDPYRGYIETDPVLEVRTEEGRIEKKYGEHGIMDVEAEVVAAASKDVKHDPPSDDLKNLLRRDSGDDDPPSGGGAGAATVGEKIPHKDKNLGGDQSSSEKKEAPSNDDKNKPDAAKSEETSNDAKNASLGETKQPELRPKQPKETSLDDSAQKPEQNAADMGPATPDVAETKPKSGNWGKDFDKQFEPEPSKGESVVSEAKPESGDFDKQFEPEPRKGERIITETKPESENRHEDFERQFEPTHGNETRAESSARSGDQASGTETQKPVSKDNSLDSSASADSHKETKSSESAGKEAHESKAEPVSENRSNNDSNRERNSTG